MYRTLFQVSVALALLFAVSGAASAAIMDVTDPADRVEGTSNNYPGGASPNGPNGAEAPQSATDNVVNVSDKTKYLNFDKGGSGFTITLDTNGPAALTGIILTTANDAPERDPASVTILGTNDDIVFDDANRRGNLVSDRNRSCNAPFRHPVARVGRLYVYTDHRRSLQELPSDIPDAQELRRRQQHADRRSPTPARTGYDGAPGDGRTGDLASSSQILSEVEG